MSVMSVMPVSVMPVSVMPASVMAVVSAVSVSVVSVSVVPVMSVSVMSVSVYYSCNRYRMKVIPLARINVPRLTVVYSRPGHINSGGRKYRLQRYVMMSITWYCNYSHCDICLLLMSHCDVCLSPCQVTTKGKGGGENYLYDQVAMDAFMKTLPENANPQIQRFKGLGTICTALSSAFSWIQKCRFLGLKV